jgi:hypothetical protein
LPAAPWARYEATILRPRRISIDGGDFTGKFSNCGGPSIGPEILATLWTIEAVLFCKITDSDSKAHIVGDAMTPELLDSGADLDTKEAAADGDSTLIIHSE